MQEAWPSRLQSNRPGKEYAYIRVSTADQNEDRQLDAIKKLKIPATQIYADKISGRDFKRTAWQQLATELTEGDTLYVHSIDRLGRNYADILEWWRILTKEKGVDIVVLDMPLLDTRHGKDLIGTLIADIVLALLSYVSQNERETIRKRQAEGIASAKARGVHLGRPIKKPPANFKQVVKRWERGKITIEEALQEAGLKQATFYNRLRELRSNKQNSQL